MADDQNKDHPAEEMDRYFKDPEYRKQKRKIHRGSPMNKRLKRYLVIAGVILALILPYAIYLFSGLPSLERIENPRPELATKVYSIDGEVLDQFFVKNRSSVSIKDVPKTVVDALIATDDKGFYSH